MTTYAQRMLRTRIGDYLVPAVGLVPALMMLGHAASAVEQRTVILRDVYRRDLLLDVNSQIAEISDLLRRLGEFNSPSLADLAFAEAPDHPSYQDAYTWEPAEMPELAAPPRNEPPDERSLIWR